MARLIATMLAGAALSGALGGCSDLYFDRRDTIALGAGDAVAANLAMETIDPWPPESGNPNIAFNGQRMQTAQERYRTGKVTEAADSQALVSNSAAGSVTQVNVGNASTTSGTTSAATTTTAQ